LRYAGKPIQIGVLPKRVNGIGANRHFVVAVKNGQAVGLQAAYKACSVLHKNVGVEGRIFHDAILLWQVQMCVNYFHHSSGDANGLCCVAVGCQTVTGYKSLPENPNGSRLLAS
jgi:hypothetical protein